MRRKRIPKYCLFFFGNTHTYERIYDEKILDTHMELHVDDDSRIGFCVRNLTTAKKALMLISTSVQLTVNETIIPKNKLITSSLMSIRNPSFLLEESKQQRLQEGLSGKYSQGWEKVTYDGPGQESLSSHNKQKDYTKDTNLDS